MATVHDVVLAWVASTDPGVAYNVYRTQTSGSYGTTPLNAVPLVATTYTDSPLAPGTWFYVVTSVLNGAESLHSNEAKAVILPAAPTNLTISSLA